MRNIMWDFNKGDSVQLAKSPLRHIITHSLRKRGFVTMKKRQLLKMLTTMILESQCQRLGISIKFHPVAGLVFEPSRTLLGKRHSHNVL